MQFYSEVLVKCVACKATLIGYIVLLNANVQQCKQGDKARKKWSMGFPSNFLTTAAVQSKNQFFFVHGVAADVLVGK